MVFVAISFPFVGVVMNVVLTIAGVGLLYTQLTGWYRRHHAQPTRDVAAVNRTSPT